MAAGVDTTDAFSLAGCFILSQVFDKVKDIIIQVQSIHSIYRLKIVEKNTKKRFNFANFLGAIPLLRNKSFGRLGGP